MLPCGTPGRGISAAHTGVALVRNKAVRGMVAPMSDFQRSHPGTCHRNPLLPSFRTRHEQKNMSRAPPVSAPTYMPMQSAVLLSEVCMEQECRMNPALLV